MAVVEIEILGRRYSLQSDRDPSHVQGVASFVDQQLRDLSGNQPESVRREHAILVALNIASELFLLRETSDQLADQLDTSLGALLVQVDEALADLPATTGSLTGIEAVRT
jgi:cell division protein ZapA (FtsZ GTPase activity inhibitor)